MTKKRERVFREVTINRPKDRVATLANTVKPGTYFWRKSDPAHSYLAVPSDTDDLKGQIVPIDPADDDPGVATVYVSPTDHVFVMTVPEAADLLIKNGQYNTQRIFSQAAGVVKKFWS